MRLEEIGWIQYKHTVSALKWDYLWAKTTGAWFYLYKPNNAKQISPRKVSTCDI